MVLRAVSEGKHGIAVSVNDQQEKGQQFAIKKIEGAFENKNCAKRTLRQLKTLRILKHENVNERKFNFVKILKDCWIAYNFAFKI